MDPCFSQPGNPKSYRYCLKTYVIENINLLEYLTSDTYDIEQTVCCNYIYLSVYLCCTFSKQGQLHGRVTGPGDVSRRKLGVHPSVLLITSVRLSFWFPLVPPCLLLEASQLCSLPGSSALWPGARRRRLLLRSRVSLSVICSTRTPPPRFVCLDSCQEAVTWREKCIFT